MSHPRHNSLRISSRADPVCPAYAACKDIQFNPFAAQQGNATVTELADDASAAAFLAGQPDSPSDMNVPIGSALGAGGPPLAIDFSLPPQFQKYSRQVLSRNPSEQYMAGPGSIVNPYTGMLPASASVAPTQAPPQAPQIVKLPVNMEIERNRAAAGESLNIHRSSSADVDCLD